MVDLARVEGRLLEADARHMRRALWHARRGLGSTSPNPVVGAVLVNGEDVVVGLGHHQQAGGPHAEIVALDAAGPHARGTTLYCTLEPCSHTNRTGPCAVAVAAAGVRRVVVAIGDPNPRVAGAGLQYLRDRGIEVTVGVGRAEALVQNAPFFSVMQRQRPWIFAKVATSLDGAIAAGSGRRTTISGPEAQRWTQQLRASVDAVAVGAGTVLVDDPLLTARDVYRHRPLTRVVFDRRLRMPPTAQLLRTIAAGPVVVVTTPAGATSDAASRLEDAGATVVACDGTIVDAVRVLARHDVMTLLVEGGATLHAALFEAGLVDHLAELVAETVLGPAGVRTGIPPGAADLRRRRVVPLGTDVLLEGDVHWTD